MNKKIIVYVLLIVALGTGGTLMAMSGKDAVSMAAQQKNTLLTADTVNVAFQGVGGRVNTVEVKEEQQVKKGDVLMTLDPVDLDLQIEKLKTDIAQADVKIKQAKDAAKSVGENFEFRKTGAIGHSSRASRVLIKPRHTCGGYCKTKAGY